MNEAVTQTGDEVRPETNEVSEPENTEENALQEQEDKATEEQQEDDKAEEIERRKREKTQRRINQLTREKKEAREEAERLRKELEKFNKQTRPNPDDFDDYQDYIQAEVDYQVAQKTAKPEPEPKSSAPDFAGIIQRGQEKYPDFDQVAKSDPNLTQEVAEMVALADNAEDIFYHLGKNPVELERISLLDPALMAREVGRLEATVTPPTPKTTNAPPPPKPLEGAQATDVDEDSLSMEEWAKRRNAKRWKQGKI